MLARVLVGLVRAYQRAAPARVRAQCLFHPTCSDYAVLALQRHGAWRGARMAARRLARCRPPNGGFDEP